MLQLDCMSTLAATTCEPSSSIVTFWPAPPPPQELSAPAAEFTPMSPCLMCATSTEPPLKSSEFNANNTYLLMSVSTGRVGEPAANAGHICTSPAHATTATTDATTATRARPRRGKRNAPAPIENPLPWCPSRGRCPRIAPIRSLLVIWVQAELHES